MKVVKDMLGGIKPATIDVPYNGSGAVDSVTKRYKGSVVKMMDATDIDHGTFFTWAGVATAGENIMGLLEVEQPVTGNYLPDTGTNNMTYRKITPCFPSTIVEAEYVRTAADGSTAAYDTNVTGSAAGTALTANDGITGTNGDMSGGWVYFLNGANKDYLHYVSQSESSGGTLTVTALAQAVVATDDLLAILPPCAQKCLFDATLTGIKSELTYGSHTYHIQGIATYISSPGIPKTRLSRTTHNGIKIANAQFFHQFTFAGSDSLPNGWTSIYKS